MAARIVRHFQRMNAVRARDVRIHWPGRPAREIPSRLPAVFDGDTVHAYAWLTGDAEEVTIELTLVDGNTVRHTLPIQRLAETTDSSAGHPLARMAAAAWIHEAPEKATDIAVEYQLLTEHTDYIVVHQRAEGEKAVDLPELKTVTHMLAAGWGGMGSVINGRTVAHSSPASGKKRGGPTVTSLGVSRSMAPMFRAADMDMNFEVASSMFSEESMGFEQIAFILDSLLEFDAASGRLLRCEMHSLLEADVDDETLLELQQLIDSGHDEYQIVLAWLVAVVRTKRGPQLARDTVRAIEKAAKKLTLNQSVSDRITIATAKRFARAAVAHP
jgi:Ca-activated chloride channel family protein